MTEPKVSHKRDTCPTEKCGRALLTPKHVLERHVPPIFNPALSGEDVTSRRLSALVLMASKMLGRDTSVERMLRAVEDRGCLEELHLEVNDQTYAAMTELHKAADSTVECVV